MKLKKALPTITAILAVIATGFSAVSAAIDNDSRNTVPAGLLVDATNVEVGIRYKVREKDWVNLSIRGRRGLEIHLGEATKRLAKRYGCFGGTQEGGEASIPRKDCIAFIKDLEIELC